MSFDSFWRVSENVFRKLWKDVKPDFFLRFWMMASGTVLTRFDWFWRLLTAFVFEVFSTASGTVWRVLETKNKFWPVCGNVFVFVETVCSLELWKQIWVILSCREFPTALDGVRTFSAIEVLMTASGDRFVFGEQIWVLSSRIENFRHHVNVWQCEGDMWRVRIDDVCLRFVYWHSDWSKHEHL